MLKEVFIGRNPSHFMPNKIVEAFILSEALLWSAYNFFIPIAAIFVVNDIKGGNIEIAASAFSTYLIARVIVEVIAGRYLSGKSDNDKLAITILGMIVLSIAYIGFSLTNTLLLLFSFYILMGIGLGIASPAKNSLFSMHLDKNKESTEWGVYDAITFIGVALATALGGFIASLYGFMPLFLLAAIINLLGTIPYFLYIRS